MQSASLKTIPAFTIALSLGSAFAFAGAASAQAIRHDSNTLHKIGKSIAYPARKDAVNVSTATHRALGRNSATNKKYVSALRQKTAVTPEGHTQPVAPITSNGHD